MLEKETGRPKLHRLQLADLTQANLNLLTKILIARRFARHAETRNTFGKARAGSRPGRSATDVALQKEPTCGLSLPTLNNLAMMDNDAAACFDRVAPLLVMSALRAQGTPPDTTRSGSQQPLGHQRGHEVRLQKPAVASQTRACTLGATMPQEDHALLLSQVETRS